MNAAIVLPKQLNVPTLVTGLIEDFVEDFQPYEIKTGGKAHVLLDEKSGAYYLTCHLEGRVLTKSCDSEATLDAADDDDEIYKLNREIQEDVTAFKSMEKDASQGRRFEDLVLEYDKSYRGTKPLKVYGGQHRLRAITKAEGDKGATLHGIRVYFGLSRAQKVEIATINNTAIAVPNDLLDRMREQLLGSELRDWCQKVGLLEKGEDFSDRRSPDMPTVRLARTLLVNYYEGKDSSDADFHQPILCKSGGVDEDYLQLRDRIDWSDKELLEMGRQFARLDHKQRDTVTARDTDSNAEYARKALSLTVVASWAYAAGYFQRRPDYLQNLYSLPDNVTSNNDPLNAKALSQARHKGIDPDTYRGLGTRSGGKELGRMLEVFLVLAGKNKKNITKELANAAIQSYEAKRAVHEAQKVLGRI